MASKNKTGKKLLKITKAKPGVDNEN